MAKQMTSSPLQRGKKDQVRLLELFENMTDTFSRSRPADLPEPPAEDGFVDVAEMRFLMKRMEEAEQKMKTEAGTESAFTAKKDMIKHEASILATFTHVIALEEYDVARKIQTILWIFLFTNGIFGICWCRSTAPIGNRGYRWINDFYITDSIRVTNFVPLGRKQIF